MFPSSSSRAEDSDRPIHAISFGALTTLFAIAIYPAVLSQSPVLSPESIVLLELLAYATIVLMLFGLFTVFYGLRRLLILEALRTKNWVGPPSSTFSTIAYVLAERTYARISILSAVMYGFLYAFISGIIVYQPRLNFSEVYLAKVPSMLAVTCCGPIGQIPRFVVYLTQHLGVLIVPVNLILLFTVSWLVGLNTSLAVFAYKNRPRQVGPKWLGGLGAIVGLFTACPSCASLFFMAAVGGAGAISIAIALAPFQVVSIAASIPVLLVTPLLMSRKLLRVVRTG